MAPNDAERTSREGGVGQTMAVTTRRYTFDEWIDSPANGMLTELVDGVPVERMSTTQDHGRVVKALWRWLDQAEHAGFGTVHLGPAAVVFDASGGAPQRPRARYLLPQCGEGVP